jgi:hypothetical protein
VDTTRRNNQEEEDAFLDDVSNSSRVAEDFCEMTIVSGQEPMILKKRPEFP